MTTITRYYSAKARGFFSSDIHGVHIPPDAVEITDEKWLELLAAEATGTKRIVPGASGHPVAANLVKTDEEAKADLLRERDAALAETDRLVARHRDELDVDGTTTLTADQYAALQSWRKQLRNITAQRGFPRVKLPRRPV